jgi:DnaK suppressor protein
MPRDKAATKKRKASGTRKTVKKAIRKKSVAKKTARSPVSRKKAAKKASKTAAKKSSKKPAAKTAGSRKNTQPKKNLRKVSIKKKTVSGKKTPSKKNTAAKRAQHSASASRRGATLGRASSGRTSFSGSAAKLQAKRTRSRRTDLLSAPKGMAGPYQLKRGEGYMSTHQLEHFRQLLWAWKRELMEEVDRTMLHMKDEAANFPDPNDRATQESEFGLELRTRDRERKLLRKIDSALQRIEDGTYGYCEETGEEIGLRRLEARPVATLCVEAQERRELAERQFRDREDQYR